MRLEVLSMEKNAPKFTLNKKLLISAAAVLVIAVLAAVLLWPANIVDTVTVEAGRESISANEFRKEDKGIDAQFVSDMTAVDMSTIGTYPVQVQYKNKTYDCTILVEDTLAPQAQVRNVSVYSNQTLQPEDFVSGIIDATDVTVSWKPEPDLTVEAQTLMTIILTDAAGNSTEYEAVLSVFVDNGMPQLSGVDAIFTYIGTEPDYLAGVTAMDDRDMAL